MFHLKYNRLNEIFHTVKKYYLFTFQVSYFNWKVWQQMSLYLFGFTEQIKKIKPRVRQVGQQSWLQWSRQYTNLNKKSTVISTKLSHLNTSKYFVLLNLCTTTTLGTLNLWPLLKGGRCSEVALCYTKWKWHPKWWSL